MTLMALQAYTEWDRAKAVERDLVDAFADSTWPAFDLFRACSLAGIEGSAIRRLKQSYRGREFLKRLDKETKGNRQQRVAVQSWVKSIA